MGAAGGKRPRSQGCGYQAPGRDQGLAGHLPREGRREGEEGRAFERERGIGGFKNAGARIGALGWSVSACLAQLF